MHSDHPGKGPRRLTWLIWICLVPVLQACSPRDGLEAALVLADIAARDAPSILKDQTALPVRKSIAYAVQGRLHHGDIYRSAGETRAGIVLVPGVHPAGKDEPRLVAMANTLARAGFSVLVPDIPSLRKLKIRITQVQEIADALAYLISRQDLAPHGRAGIFAFSYAVGPSILAAAREGSRHQVRFIFGVGGYYDLHAVATFFTTGYFKVDGIWHYIKPNHYGMWVFALSNADFLTSRKDAETIRAIAWRRLKHPEKGVEDLVRRLGPDGKALYTFLTNQDREKAAGLFAQLPEPIRAEVEALNLRTKDLSRITARVILVHGRNDSIIPYSESVALAAALPQDQVELYIVDDLAHVDLGRPGLMDTIRLWQAVSSLLAMRK